MIPESETMRVVGVKRLSQYLRRLVEENRHLRGIGVSGEVSNLKPFASGLWFDLKEEEAVLSCVAWSDVAGKLADLRNGQAITAYGSVGVYPKRSGYQFVVRNVTIAGFGDLHKRYEELRLRLEAEGLFERPKRPLPRFPFRIALVSSPRADGYNDFVQIMRSRAPHVAVVLVETPVQGLAAAPDIADAIRRASRLPVDAIVIARGGGSAEDIFAFSQEPVVRAVANAEHPTISAIGHAKDIPLCDLVADRRAETPSNAAHLLTERTTAELIAAIADWERRLGAGARRPVIAARRRLRGALDRSALVSPERIADAHRRRLLEGIDGLGVALTQAFARRRTRLETVTRRLDRLDPLARLGEHRATLRVLHYRLSRIEVVAPRSQRAQGAGVRLRDAMPRLLERKRARATLASRALSASDPTALLARGYAIVEYAGHVVRDAAAVPLGERVEAKLAHGTLLARVEGRENA
ncbi:MAG TPA: exodeoxyribonuclease VII large subunit [Candidatus Acidoferrales bacterium]|nr:exodeoxyribonuclease VII large subunit [Candidatus Acidoferrales bacterium]